MKLQKNLEPDFAENAPSAAIAPAYRLQALPSSYPQRTHYPPATTL